MYHGELNYMARMKFMNTEIDNLTMQETLDAIDKIIAKVLYWDTTGTIIMSNWFRLWG